MTTGNISTPCPTAAIDHGETLSRAKSTREKTGIYPPQFPRCMYLTFPALECERFPFSISPMCKLLSVKISFYDHDGAACVELAECPQTVVVSPKRP